MLQSPYVVHLHQAFCQLVGEGRKLVDDGHGRADQGYFQGDGARDGDDGVAGPDQVVDPFAADGDIEAGCREQRGYVIIAQRGCQRKDELDIGKALLQQAGRFGDNRQEALDLVPAAAGEEPDDPAAGIEPETGGSIVPPSW